MNMRLNQLIYFILLLTTTILADIEDKLRCKVGGLYVTNRETEVRLTPANLPVGAKLNTQDQLDHKTDGSVLYLEAFYRFNDKHSINTSYYSINSTGHKEIDEDITWDGNVIDAGAIVDSYMKVKVFSLSYGYSFYHNDDIELMLIGGLHITDLDVGLSAEGTINNVPTEKVSASGGITAPLPVIGFKGEYTIIPKELFVTYQAEYFYLDFDSYQGSFLTSGLDLEYRFLEHFGIGMGVHANEIYVEDEDEDRRVEGSHQFKGITAYFTYVY